MAILAFDDDVGGDDAVLDVINDHGNDVLLLKKSGTEVGTLNKYGEYISTSGWDHRVLNIPLGDIAADYGDSSFKDPLFVFPKAVTLESAYISVDTTVGADATNYQTIAIFDEDGNSIVSRTSAAGFTAATPVSMGTLDTTHKILKAEEGIYLTFTKVVSGKALSGFVVHLEYSVNETESSSITAEEQVVKSLDAGGIITSDQTVRDHLNVRSKDGAEPYFNVSLDGIMTTPLAANRFFAQAYSAGDITASADDTKIITAFRANGKIQLEAIYVGIKAAHLANSDTAYETIDFKKNYSNKLAKILVGGPYSSGTAFTAGIWVKISTLEEKQSELASGDKISVHFTAATTGEDIAGLYFVFIYRKLD